MCLHRFQWNSGYIFFKLSFSQKLTEKKLSLDKTQLCLEILEFSKIPLYQPKSMEPPRVEKGAITGGGVPICQYLAKRINKKGGFHGYGLMIASSCKVLMHRSITIPSTKTKLIGGPQSEGYLFWNH